MAKNKLELNWIGKNEYKEIEPRILIENPEFSNVKLDAKTENMLIHGDNLLALKALENNFSNKVKLINIDPPYNTGTAFEHYEDRKSTRLNSSHVAISYAVFCLKKKIKI